MFVVLPSSSQGSKAMISNSNARKNSFPNRNSNTAQVRVSQEHSLLGLFCYILAEYARSVLTGFLKDFPWVKDSIVRMKMQSRWEEEKKINDSVKLIEYLNTFDKCLPKGERARCVEKQSPTQRTWLDLPRKERESEE